MLTLITVGRIIIASTIIADIILAPPVNWWSGSPSNIAFSILNIIGFSTIMPIRPYITEGMAARSSTAPPTKLPSLFPAISDRNTAVRRPIGTPIRIADAVPTSDDSIM